MDVPYESFLSSKPFLLVGPNGTHFYVHGNLITNHSSVFAVEVNGPMREAETRLINVKDVDGDIDDKTLMRFIEFAYRGDYTVPPPDILLSSSDIDGASTTLSSKASNRGMINISAVGGASPRATIPSEEVEEVPFAEPAPEEAEPVPEEPVAEEPSVEEPPPEDEVRLVEDDDGWAFPAPSKKKDKKKKRSTLQNHWYDEYEVKPASPTRQQSEMSKSEKLWANFRAQLLHTEQKPWQPVPNSDPCEDYTEVFLCHARLYVFSNRYECGALRDLCLRKLRSTLATFELHQKRCADVAKLVQYAYTHTQTFSEGNDKLRTLISDYVVCKAEKMCYEPELLGILQDCDGLARDLMVKLMQRLD